MKLKRYRVIKSKNALQIQSRNIFSFHWMNEGWANSLTDCIEYIRFLKKRKVILHKE